MKKDRKYYLYLGLAIAVFALLRLMAPSPYDHTVTYAKDDTNPFGGFVLGELLQGLFPKDSIHHSFSTPYEFSGQLGDNNVLIVASTFAPSKPDTDVLLKHVSSGGHLFISAQNFYGQFSDTLKLVAETNYVWEGDGPKSGTDSSYVRFVTPSLDTVRQYSFRYDHIFNYFRSFDSTRTTVIARNNFDNPVTLRVKWGKGSIIMNSTPIAFTNVYMLQGNHAQLISRMLSYLPEKDVFWTEYFQNGRNEAQTPLRFILRTEPLRWAYFITIGCLIAYMVFQLKRRQRIIPIQDPMKNTTLEFVSTIGNLYYANGHHKNIAEKKILFFFDYVRTRYSVNTTQLNDAFVLTLTNKSGKPLEDVRKLIQKIINIKKNNEIAAVDLVELDELMASFYGHTD